MTADWDNYENWAFDSGVDKKNIWKGFSAYTKGHH